MKHGLELVGYTVMNTDKTDIFSLYHNSYNVTEIKI